MNLEFYVTEFIGTFFIAWTSELANVQEGSRFIEPIATAGVLVALTYTFEYLSGAHFNPVVSLAMWLSWSNRITSKNLITYIAVQFTAGICGSMVVFAFLKDGPDVSSYGNWLFGT